MALPLVIKGHINTRSRALHLSLPMFTYRRSGRFACFLPAYPGRRWAIRDPRSAQSLEGPPKRKQRNRTTRSTSVRIQENPRPFTPTGYTVTSVKRWKPPVTTQYYALLADCRLWKTRARKLCLRFGNNACILLHISLGKMEDTCPSQNYFLHPFSLPRNDRWVFLPGRKLNEKPKIFNFCFCTFGIWFLRPLQTLEVFTFSKKILKRFSKIQSGLKMN